MTLAPADTAAPDLRTPAPAGGPVVADRAGARVARFGIRLGPADTVWSWSRNMHSMLGITDDCEPGPEVLARAVHPDDRASFRRMLTVALERQQPFCRRSRLARPDGVVRTVETSGFVAASRDRASSEVVGRIALVADWSLPVLDVPDGAFTDGDLAVALLARSDAAYRYAFVRYASLVRHVARRRLRDPTQVDDVAQSVFETLWAHPERFDSTRGSLAAYLQVQARSRSLDLLRSEASRRSRVHRFVDANPQAGPDPAGGISEPAGSDIRTALDLLPAKERQPIELAFFGAMSYRQVSAHLGLPEGTVKSRIRSGLGRLRRLEGMDHLGGDTEC